MPRIDAENNIHSKGQLNFNVWFHVWGGGCALRLEILNSWSFEYLKNNINRLWKHISVLSISSSRPLEFKSSSLAVFSLPSN
jgi:hypothetical protein